MSNLVVRWLTSLMIMFLAAVPAPAQDGSTRPLRLLLGFPAGGSVDKLARTLGEGFRQQTGQTVIVEGKVGANTILAANACKSAEPDGSTVCLFGSDTISVNPFLYKNLPYEPLVDFEPITNVVYSQGVVIINKALPVSTFQNFVKYSKEHPGKLNYGSLGIGGASYLLAEWLKEKTGADLTHIPYGGGAPAMLAFERGDIDLIYLVASPDIIARIKSGNARAVLVLGDKRNSNLPEVPTFAEVGFPPYDLQLYFGLFAPVGTPKRTIDRLNVEFVKVIRSQFFNERFLKDPGYEAVDNTPAEFRAFLEKDRLLNRELLTSLGIKRNL
jgi:tripartite-type tricarboxylate transporter receptor subunit TctC